MTTARRSTGLHQTDGENLSPQEREAGMDSRFRGNGEEQCGNRRIPNLSMDG